MEQRRYSYNELIRTMLVIVASFVLLLFACGFSAVYAEDISSDADAEKECFFQKTSASTSTEQEPDKVSSDVPSAPAAVTDNDDSNRSAGFDEELSDASTGIGSNGSSKADTEADIDSPTLDDQDYTEVGAGSIEAEGSDTDALIGADEITVDRIQDDASGSNDASEPDSDAADGVTTDPYQQEAIQYWNGKYRELTPNDVINTDALTIRISNTEFIFDISGNSLQLWTSNDSIGQRFSFVPNGDNTFRIVSSKTGKVLQIKNGMVVSGNSIVLGRYLGKACQKWRILYDVENGSYVLLSAADNRYTVGYGDSSKGKGLILRFRDDTAGRAVSLMKPVPIVPDDSYSFWNGSSTGFAVGVEKASKTSGSDAVAQKRSNKNVNISQLFELVWSNAYGYYVLLNTNSGKVLDVNGTNVYINDFNNSGTQFWTFETATDTRGYYIRSAVTRKQLAVVNDTITSGASLVLLPFRENESRAWLMRKAKASNNAVNCLTALKIKADWYTEAGEEYPHEDYQAYHPKVVAFDEPWNGYKYWMAYTPYPNANSDYEDPCIAASNDLVNWTIPEGLTNPLHDTHLDGAKSIHNSDTHMLYNPDTGRMEVFWRLVEGSKTRIYMAVSYDGIHWTDRNGEEDKEEIIFMPDVNVRDCISPVFIYEDGIYRVWYVGSQTGDIYYRETADFDNWTDEIRLNIPYEYTGMKTWHFDIEKTDKGYEAVLAAFDQWDNRNRMDLWYSSSDNGLTGWSNAEVILRPTTGSANWDNTGIYRCCLLKIRDTYLVYYGGTFSSKLKHGIGVVYGTDIRNLQSVNVDFIKEGNEAVVAAFADALQNYIYA